MGRSAHIPSYLALVVSRTYLCSSAFICGDFTATSFIPRQISHITIPIIPSQPIMRTALAICVSCSKTPEPAKQIVPVVNNVLSIADRQQRQILRARISHISGKRQELLEKEEQANATPCDWRRKKK
jgi:hypothetical protein